mgnify:CR=1 FL=1
MKTTSLLAAAAALAVVVALLVSPAGAEDEAGASPAAAPPSGPPARATLHAMHAARAADADRHHAEAAGVGHRRRQLREGDVVHAALDDRVLAAQQLRDS